LQPNLIKEQLKKYRIPISEMRRIKEGGDFVTESGEAIPNSQLVTPARPSRSYAYCSDTAFSGAVAEAVKNADLLYHEATFAEADRQIAIETFHSTGVQAATIARMANAKKLLIGHFSGRYKTTDDILAEARSVFPETYAVEDNDVYSIES
jgi:ribonuclease Z